MKQGKLKGAVSIILVLAIIISTITVNTTVKAATYTAKNLTVKAKVGKKVILKPIVYKDGVKVNLKSKDYRVIWTEQCKVYGGIVNGGAIKKIKKLKAEDCYNSSYKKKYAYIVLYKEEEVTRGTVRILSKGKLKVETVKIKSLKQTKNEEENGLTLKCKKLTTATGIEVMIATDRKFTDKKKKTYANITSMAIDEIESGKIYYVKARGFAVIKKKKTYGKWSKVVKVEVPIEE